MDDPLKENISVLDSMVRARGLKLSRVNPEEDLLLPPSGDGEDLKAYRSILDHYAARLLLKEVIKAEDQKKWLYGRRQVERFCDPAAVDDFLSRLADLRILKLSANGIPSILKSVHSFGPTYEWYTVRVLREDFSCPSAWGVLFDGLGSGGDHDVIASLAGLFLYVEVKTSPPGRIESPEIGGFVRRLIDTAPDIAVFNNDTHLRMKDKIVPMMESAIESVHGKGGERVHFKRLEREIFHLNGAIYILNSKPDLRRNLEIVFRHHHRYGNRVLETIP